MSQQIISVNGIELCVHIVGPEQGAPIWLLHGFPECWHSWREQIPALAAAGYRVFAPQMRGYGQTRSGSSNARCQATTAPQSWPTITTWV